MQCNAMFYAEQSSVELSTLQQCSIAEQSRTMIMIKMIKMMMTTFLEWSRAARSASPGAINSPPLVPIAYPLVCFHLFSLLHFLLISFSSSAFVLFHFFSLFPPLLIFTFSSILLISLPPSLQSSSSSSLRTDYQYNPRGSMASVKKKILITHNLRMLKIKTKEYGKGQTLHNFMLEEVVLQDDLYALYHICCAALCREINRCCYFHCLFSYFCSNNNHYPPLRMMMLLLLLFSIVYHIWHSYLSL